ncbi:MAG: GNAT family N-acetyltransferase [Elusimicrobia bacterium]|nr:GNAT family N-acetyltransferase [Elusimicrobiota bacterium]
MRRLLVRTWAAAFGGLLSPSELREVSRRWHGVAALAEQTRDKGCCSAVAVSASGRLLGLVTCGRSGARAAFLNRLYVRPGRQGGGLGERLLAAAWRAWPEARSMRLEVLKDNDRAIAFYRRHGFRVAGRRSMRLEGKAVPLAVMEASRPGRRSS